MAELPTRIAAIGSGRGTSPTDAEAATLSFLAAPKYQAAFRALTAPNRQSSARAHRPTILACCIKALNTCDGSKPGSFEQTAARALGR